LAASRRLLDGTDATVLLLEAGGGPGEGGSSLSNPPQWVENFASRYDWAYHYAPSPHVENRSIPLALGKVLGGGGSVNGLIWARGNRADYDGWAAAGNPGWDFDSVLPLFKKSEDWEDGAGEIRGAGGPIHVERARHPGHHLRRPLHHACRRGRGDAQRTAQRFWQPQRPHHPGQGGQF
jgi:choline dehydrogenase